MILLHGGHARLDQRVVAAPDPRPGKAELCRAVVGYLALDGQQCDHASAVDYVGLQ